MCKRLLFRHLIKRAAKIQKLNRPEIEEEFIFKDETNTKEMF